MARVRRTRALLCDYDEIWEYIARRDTAAADRLIDRFEAVLRHLADSPHTGRTVSRLGIGLRSFPVGTYLVFYRPTEDGVVVVRVLHGARDITSSLFGQS